MKRKCDYAGMSRCSVVLIEMALDAIELYFEYQARFRNSAHFEQTTSNRRIQERRSVFVAQTSREPGSSCNWREKDAANRGGSTDRARLYERGTSQ